MKRKPVTLRGDQMHLIAGAIQAGEFTDRSSAVRACIRSYFAANPVETAALVANHGELSFDDVVDVLDVQRDELAAAVAAIDEDATPEATSTSLEAIEAEFSGLDTEEGTR